MIVARGLVSLAQEEVRRDLEGDVTKGLSEGQRGQVTVAVTVTSGAYLFAPALVAVALITG